MGEDELSTIETLKAYREVVTILIQQHRGPVVNFPGDNWIDKQSSLFHPLTAIFAKPFETEFIFIFQ